MIDLHTHSTASDGSYSPRELVEEAVRLGLTALALTDHDTINGLREAESAALGTTLRFIRGIELSVSWEPGECHLLGLGLRQCSPSLNTAISKLNREREIRNLEIIELMREGGVEIAYEDIKRIAGKAVIGRPHFASFLVEKRVVRNRQQAFNLYLAKGRPFYAPKISLSLVESIQAIHDSGAMAVLAHPFSLYIAWGRLPALLAEWKDLGLDGIEAYHPTAKPGPCRRLEKLGQELGFIITAGSDFHGAYREGHKLGHGPGKMAIEERFLAGLPL